MSNYTKQCHCTVFSTLRFVIVPQSDFDAAGIVFSSISQFVAEGGGHAQRSVHTVRLGDRKLRCLQSGDDRWRVHGGQRPSKTQRRPPRRPGGFDVSSPAESDRRLPYQTPASRHAQTARRHPLRCASVGAMVTTGARSLKLSAHLKSNWKQVLFQPKRKAKTAPTRFAVLANHSRYPLLARQAVNSRYRLWLAKTFWFGWNKMFHFCFS